jgi:thioredoxin reductase (NADPH)
MKTDLIILGGGPAGLTSGMYAARGRIPVLLLERGVTGGQMAATELVDNYPGFNEPILGYDLAQKMEGQARKFGLEIVQTDVQSVLPKENGFLITCDSGEEFESKALILATGASPVKPGVPGEIELAGKGVSYCAVCDGPFFRDLEVAVVGGGDSAVEESIYLSRFAAKVHLVHRRDRLRAVKEIQERAFAESKLSFHWNSVPARIIGDKDVQGLVIRSVIDGSESLLPVGGVFFYVGIHANTQCFSGLVDTNGAGFVITDEKMACSRPGVFAAGDVRSKMLRQIATAVGDGAIAAYSAQLYLESL